MKNRGDKILAPASGFPRAADGTIYAIQYLRAIAALLVVFFHISASIAHEEGGGAVFALGAIGVDIFFVLSGLLMAMIVERDDKPGAAFLFRRFARIAPLYYLSTIAVFALASFAPALLNSATADWSHLAHSLLFLPYEGANGELTPILTLGWTLNYEFFFYVLIAVTIRLTGDRSLLGVAAILCWLAAAGMAAEPGNAFLRFYSDPIIVEFALGILIYRYVFRRPRDLSNISVYWLALATGIVFVALRYDIAADQWRFFTWGVPAALVVSGGLHTFTARYEWPRRFGDWSYSVYLLHVYVIQLAVKIVLPATGVNEVPVLVAAAILVPVILAMAALLYNRVEMPAMRWLVRRGGRFVAASSTQAGKEKAGRAGPASP